MQTVTADQLKSAAFSADVTHVPVRMCSICEAELHYVVDDGEVFFDSSCDCVSFTTPPRWVGWDELANTINRQKNEKYRNALTQRFGLNIESVK